MLPVIEQGFSKCFLTREPLFLFPRDPVFSKKLFLRSFMAHLVDFVNLHSVEYSLHVVSQQQTLTKNIVKGSTVCLQCWQDRLPVWHLLRAQPGDMRFILLFSFIGHKGVQHLDYELLSKQHFNIMSTGWKLADVTALNLLEMPDGKINTVIFFFQ